MNKHSLFSSIFARFTAVLILIQSLSGLAQVAEKPVSEEDRPLIQIALLLDTSGSMSGMIKQAQTQLWAIVNEFLAADQNGLRPRLEVSLYQYGTPSLGNENGFIKQLCPLTDDLDRVSEELFKLTTNGGDEYCGWAIRTAANELQWSPRNSDYKAIFIAGNEPFGQGPVKYQESCKAAITKGIVVNTIHCQGGSNDGWQDGARLADGQFMSIDMNKAVVEVETPYDKKIAELNVKLNKTYVAYGAKGQANSARQAVMDSNSLSIGGANLAARAKTKASAYYSNSSWDLVDAAAEEDFEIAKVDEKELPEELQKMTVEEREKYVEEKRAEREVVKKQIQELSEQRDTFIAKHQKELAKNEDTLGNQVQNAVREQAEKKGFDFK